MKRSDRGRQFISSICILSNINFQRFSPEMSEARVEKFILSYNIREQRHSRWERKVSALRSSSRYQFSATSRKLMGRLQRLKTADKSTGPKRSVLVALTTSVKYETWNCKLHLKRVSV